MFVFTDEWYLSLLAGQVSLLQLKCIISQLISSTCPAAVIKKRRKWNGMSLLFSVIHPPMHKTINHSTRTVKSQLFFYIFPRIKINVVRTANMHMSFMFHTQESIKQTFQFNIKRFFGEKRGPFNDRLFDTKR